MNKTLTEGTLIKFNYTNWRGEIATREAIVYDFIVGSNKWHTEEQLLLRAFDTTKKDIRFFAVKDMHKIQVLKEGK